MVKPVVVEVKDNHRGLMYELPDPPAASEWTCDESWETDAATPVSAPSPPWEASPSVAPSPPPEVAPAVESMLAPLPLQGVDDKTFFAIAFGVAYTGQSGYRRYFSVPNELAVWAFSLQKPEIASFHRHIEPGPRPPGTRGKTCPSTLRCDVFERDRTMLWHELTDFLDKWGEPQALLFTKVAPTARECIRWLAATAHANDTLSDRVLLADQLAAGILLKKQAQCDGQKLSSRVKVAFACERDIQQKCYEHTEQQNIARGNVDCALAYAAATATAVRTVVREATSQQQRRQDDDELTHRMEAYIQQQRQSTSMW
eukprot:TRINITY_DN596_c0_g1_i7.p1 TRINITY_DN596_c0_g1~~TRINITY_DN596_c0_g1_i7.p1  ORF type:complete len:359 (+),score=70.10 TRINITY_DN596_c0_g1_i7:137-1078(+)